MREILQDSELRLDIPGSDLAIQMLKIIKFDRLGRNIAITRGLKRADFYRNWSKTAAIWHDLILLS